MNHPFKRKRKVPEMAPPPSPLCTWTDEDQAYVDMMLWKSATRNFRKIIDKAPKKEPELSEQPLPELNKMVTELEIKTRSMGLPRSVVIDYCSFQIAIISDVSSNCILIQMGLRIGKRMC